MSDFERKKVFELYKCYELPVLNICLEFETKDFLPLCKEKGIRPSQFLCYAIAKTSMDIKEFRFRLENGKVIEVNDLTTSFTVKNPNIGFNFCSTSFVPDFYSFLSNSEKSKQKAESAKDFLRDDPSRRNYIFISFLPWYKFTSIQHPVKNFKDASVPMFAIGKFEKKQSGLSFPLSIQVHHGFADGYHIQLFSEKLNMNIASLLKELI